MAVATRKDLIPDIDGYQPDSECPTRVYVNGIRIPASDVDVYLRKEGALDITRYAEVSFASPFAGTSYTDVFQSFVYENQTKPDTLRIDSRTTNNSETDYTPIFHGIVTGVGSSTHNNERMYQCRAQGPAHFLDKTSASKQFGGGVSTQFSTSDVIKYVTDELNGKLPITIDKYDGDSESTFSGAFNPIIDVFQDVALSVLDKKVVTPKTFQANKHSLKNVINWLRDKFGGRVWIQPTKEGGQFVWSDNPTKTAGSHKAHYLGGNTNVVNNNALAEIRPINTLIVNGQAKKSVTSIGEFEINRPAGTFSKIKVRHKQLYERAGSSELLGDTVRKSDAESKQEVVNEARSILKERIDQATAGSMQVLLDSFIQPFDTIEAKPTCDSATTDELEPLMYEVQRAHYIAHPNENTLPYIDLTVGLHTDIQDDIEVVDSWNKDVI